nr:MASE1 domain-containing protein [Legionella antarctica]
MQLVVNQNSKILHHDLVWKLKKLFLLRLLTENIFIFILQYIGLNLSTLSQNLSPLWFATGTSCAYLFLRGYSVMPGIWLGTFSAYYLAKAGFLVSICCAIVLSLQATLLLWFSHHFLGPTLIFYRLGKFVTFVIYTAILTCIISFMLIYICYTLLLHVEASALQLWLQWWLANLNAILIFSCALITFDAYFLDFYAAKPLKKTYVLFVLLLLVMISLIFTQTIVSTIVLALLVMLITIYVSVHFGWCGAIAAVFLSGMLFCFAGFFRTEVFSFSSVSVSLLLLQLFLCANTIIGLSVAIIYKKN